MEPSRSSGTRLAQGLDEALAIGRVVEVQLGPIAAIHRTAASASLNKIGVGAQLGDRRIAPYAP